MEWTNVRVIFQLSGRREQCDEPAVERVSLTDGWLVLQHSKGRIEAYPAHIVSDVSIYSRPT